jgi:hypothetical protein
MRLLAVSALRRIALLFRRESAAIASGTRAVWLLFLDDVDALQVRAFADHDDAWQYQGNLLRGYLVRGDWVLAVREVGLQATMMGLNSLNPIVVQPNPPETDFDRRLGVRRAREVDVQRW